MKSLFLGVMQFFHPAIHSNALASEKTRPILGDSFYRNCMRLGLIVSYEIGTELIRKYFRGNSETWGLNTLSVMVMGGVLMWDYYENALLNAALAKAVTDDGAVLKTCRCSEGDRLKELVAGPARDLSEYALIQTLSYAPWTRAFAWVGEIFRVGRGLFGYRSGQSAMCGRHRSREAGKHNAFVLGVGMSFFMMRRILLSLIRQMTGAESFFIAATVESLLYPYFIIAVMRATPPVNSGKGVDLFYYYHEMMSRIIADLSGKIAALFEQDAGDTWITEAMQALQRYAEQNQIPEYLCHLYNNRLRFVPEAMLKDAAHRHFFDAYYEDVKRKLDKTIKLQRAGQKGKILRNPKPALLAWVPWLPDIITWPFLDASSKKILGMAFDQVGSDVLHTAETGLRALRDFQQGRREHLRYTLFANTVNFVEDESAEDGMVLINSRVDSVEPGFFAQRMVEDYFSVDRASVGEEKKTLETSDSEDEWLMVGPLMESERSLSPSVRRPC